MIRPVNPIILNSLDSPQEVIAYYIVFLIFSIIISFIMWLIYWLLQYQVKNPNDPKIKLIQSVVYLEIFSLLLAWASYFVEVNVSFKFKPLVGFILSLVGGGMLIPIIILFTIFKVYHRRNPRIKEVESEEEEVSNVIQ